jgi:hypothetical protein
MLGFLTPALASQEEAPKEPGGERLPLAKDLSKNIKARLLEAKLSVTRGQNLIAKFVTTSPGPDPAKEFTVRFPSHSHTTHEMTLMSVIEGCVDWKAGDPDAHQWHPATVTATFSVPAGVEGYVTDYSKWFLHSFEPPKK